MNLFQISDNPERADRSRNRENLPLAGRFPHLHLPSSPVFLVEQEECKDVHCGVWRKATWLSVLRQHLEVDCYGRRQVSVGGHDVKCERPFFVAAPFVSEYLDSSVLQFVMKHASGHYLYLWSELLQLYLAKNAL